MQGKRPTTRAHRAWHGVRLTGLALFAYVFIQQCRSTGIPFDRERLLLWIGAAMAVTCVGRPWRQSVYLARDWIWFVFILLAYDYSRGLAERLGAPVQVQAQLNVEKFVFFGKVPSLWLQQHLYTAGRIRWWDVLVSLTYASHFVFPFVLVGVLWVWNRERYRRFIFRLSVVSFAAVATFAVMPTAPPWMAADRHLIPHVERNVGYGWGRINFKVAATLIDKGRLAANAVAAIPSLHAAWSLIVALMVWPLIKHKWLRPLLLVYPVLMGFTIVYGGEHYAIDVFAGWLYVAGAFWLCRRVEQWFAGRRADRFLDTLEEPDVVEEPAALLDVDDEDTVPLTF